MEYAHTSLISSTTGLWPFEGSLSYQPLLFPENELNLAVPSMQQHLQRCQRTWYKMRQALLRTRERHHLFANRRCTPAPLYQPGQKLWLAAKDIPSHKLDPNIIGLYGIDTAISVCGLAQAPCTLADTYDVPRFSN